MSNNTINSDPTNPHGSGDGRTERPEGSVNDLSTMRAEQQRKRYRVGDVLLGRYRITGELGQGGMGVVFRCFDETGGIDVAVKVLPPEISHNTIEMEEVRENFRLVAGLTHENIAAVRTLDRDQSGGEYVLVMECVEGVNLRRWCRELAQKGDGVSLETILPVVQQAAAALDYAHARRIVHRDVKPSNVMVAHDGTVKVLDFGLAAQIHTSMTRVSQVQGGTSGTAPYMAPEQWRGRNQGAATDQYALAVTVYQILAGHLPFESSDPSVLREAVLNEPPEPLPNLDKKPWKALAIALAKDPVERYASCSDFVAALGGGKAKAGNSSTFFSRKKKGSKENRGKGSFAKAAMWLLLLALLAAGGYYGYTQWASVPTSPEEAQSQAEQAEGNKEKRQAETQQTQEAKRQKRISSLLDKARSKYAAANHTAALETIGQIRALVPNHAEAAALRKQVVDAIQRQADRRDPGDETAAPEPIAYTVETDPPGASLTLTHDERGMVFDKTVPQDGEEINLVPGVYHALVTAAGHRTIQQDIKVSAERTAWRPKLSELRGELVVRTQPGVAVSVETKEGRTIPFGTTNDRGELSIDTLREGGYTVRLSLKNHRTHAETISLIENKPVEINEQLTPKPGRIKIGGRPALEVWKDGRKLGSANEWLNLPAGKHELELRCRGFRTEQVSVTIPPAGDTVKASPNLVPEAGAVRIAAKTLREARDYLAQQKARVKIGDGDWKTVTLPYTEEGLSVGRHEARIEVPGFSVQGGTGSRGRSTSKTVTVADGKTASAEFALVPEPGYVTIVCNARGAEIFAADGKKLGNAGDRLSLAPFVEHTLTVKAPKHKAATGKALIPEPGKDIGTRSVTLEEITDPTANNVLDMAFVEIAPGSFKMGSNDGDGDEKPIHDVRISHRFWMGKYEVTLSEYREFMKSSGDTGGIDWDDDDCPYKKRNGYPLDGNKFSRDERQPVVEASWHGAVAFCKWLTERERRAGRLPDGYVYRLPTEAEWEYCCRAGTRTVYSWGDNFGQGNCNAENDKGSNEDKQCSYFSNRGLPVDSTMSVGTFSSNPWGLYDMHGNVWEWCYDWYDSDYYGKSPETNPVNTEAASFRVFRGGCWIDSSRGVRSANRDRFWPENTSGGLGFRACLAPRIRE